MKKTIPILASIFIISNTLFCQNFSFEKIYSRSNFDKVYDMIKTQDNKFILVGLTKTENNFSNIYIIKADENGDTIWTRYYGGNIDAVGMSIACIQDNQYMIAGHLDNNAYLLKIDDLGDSLWSYIQPHIYLNYYGAIATITDTSFLTAEMRYTTSCYMNPPTVYIKKTYSLSDTVLAEINETIVHDIKLVSYDQFVIAGEDYNNPFLDKYDLYGNRIFRLLGHYGSVYAVLKSTDNHLYLTGHDFMNQSSFVWKIDLSGNIIWTKLYLYGGCSTAYSICLTNNGQLLITGEYYNKLYVLGINSDGDSLGIAELDHFQEQTGRSIISHEGFAYITGNIRETDTDYSICFLKLNIDSLLTGYNKPVFPTLKNFKIFPNPASDIINIKLPNYLINNEINIILTNIHSKEIFREKRFVNNNITTISTKKLIKGIYLISIEIPNKQSISKKIMIK